MFDNDIEPICFNEKGFRDNEINTDSINHFLRLKDGGAKKVENKKAEECFYFQGLNELKCNGKYVFAFVDIKLDESYINEIHGNGIRDFGCYGRLCRVIVHKNTEVNLYEEICIFQLFLDYRKPVYVIKYKVLDSFNSTELEAFQYKCLRGSTNLYYFGIRYTCAVFENEGIPNYFVDKIDGSNIGIVVSKIDSTINELGCCCTMYSSEFDKRWHFDKDDLLPLEKAYFVSPLSDDDDEIEDDFYEI